MACESSGRDNGQEKNAAETVNVAATTKRIRKNHVAASAGILRKVEAVFVDAANRTSRNISISIARVPTTASVVLPSASAAITPAIPSAYLTCGTALMAAAKSLLGAGELGSITAYSYLKSY
jgi:hypothetical protein